MFRRTGDLSRCFGSIGPVLAVAVLLNLATGSAASPAAEPLREAAPPTEPREVAVHAPPPTQQATEHVELGNPSSLRKAEDRGPAQHLDPGEPNFPVGSYLDEARFGVEDISSGDWPGPYQVSSMSGDSGEQPGFRMETSRGWLEFRLAGAPAVQPTTRGHHIEFRWGDTTLAIDLFASEVKETIVLGSPPASSQVTFEFSTSFQVAQVADGISIRGSDGKEWLFVPNPIVVDSGGEEGTASFVLQEGSLSIDIDPAFLASATYPVVIDPTVVVSNSPADVVQTANSRRVVKAANGRVGLIDGSGGLLTLRTAVSPYTSWSSTNLVSDFVGDQASAAQAGDTAYVVYEGGTDGRISFFPLTYSGAAWSMGNSTVLVGSDAYEPSISVDPEGRIWVFYEDSGVKKLRYRRSSDAGGSWSTPADVASLASNGSQPASSSPVTYGSRVGVAFNNGAGSLRWISSPRGTVSWTGLSTRGPVKTSNFSTVATSDSRVFLGWAEPENRYAVLEGSQWTNGTIFDPADWPTPTSNVATGPTLTTDGLNVGALYTLDIGVNQQQLRRTLLNGYQPPVDMHPGQAAFGTVWDHVTTQSQWNDRTNASKDKIENDVEFVKNNGDELYLRGLAPFDTVTAIISVGASMRNSPGETPGGIKPTFEYWSGSNWISASNVTDTTFGFMNSGVISFTQPGNWAQRSVNGYYGYWLRIKRTAIESLQLPRATQITPIVSHRSLTAQATGPQGALTHHFWTATRGAPTQLLSETVDITPPTGSITINNGAEYTNNRLIQLDLTCSDGSQCMSRIRWNFSPGDPCNVGSDWSPFSSPKTVNLPSGDGIRTLCSTYRDPAGNWSSTYADAIVLDSTPPQIEGVAVDNPSFSPNEDGIKDTVRIVATIADATPTSWILDFQPNDSPELLDRRMATSSTNIDELWSGSGAPEGPYRATLKVLDAAGNLAQLIIQLRIDVTSPVIIPQSVMPHDRANVPFSSQPLFAQILDPRGAGVLPGSVVFELENVQDEQLLTLSGTSVQPRGTSGWWSTSPVTLQSGNLYRTRVNATDLAGNSASFAHEPASFGGGFRAVTLTPSVTDVTVPETSCAVSQSINPDGTRFVTCSNVPLTLDATSVTLNGSRHGDEVGYIVQFVSLSTAVFKTTIAGVPLTHPASFNSSPSEIMMPFNIPDTTDTTSTYTVPEVTTNLGELTGRVPAFWNDASLQMETTTTSSAGHVGCQEPISPSGVDLGCTPDPTQNRHFAVVRSSIADPESWIANWAATHKLQLLDRWSTHAWTLEGHPSAIQAASTDSTLAALVRLGSFELVISWTEPDCSAMTVLTSHYLNANIPIKRGIKAQFAGESATCEAVPISIAPTRPLASCPINHCDPPIDPAPVCAPSLKETWVSTSHTIQDAPNLDLAWLRSRHKFEWDGCDHAKLKETPMSLVRAGTGYNWWHKDWPESTLVTWGSRPTVSASFEGSFFSRGALVPDCDVHVRSNVAFNSKGRGIFLTAKTITGGWISCNLPLHSATSPHELEHDDWSYYEGAVDDFIIGLSPNGDVRL